MDIRFRLEEKGLYRMLNAALLMSMGMFGAGRYFGIAEPGLQHVLVMLTIALVLTIWNYLSVKGRLLCALGAVGAFGATAVVVGLPDCVAFLGSYGNWLIGGKLWQEDWVRGYEILQVLFLTVICYLLQIVLEKDFRIKLFSALPAAAVPVYCFFAEKELSHAGMALIICYLATVVMEWIQRHWKKEKSRNIQAYMLWMMPFLALYLIVLLCLPVPEQPYDWQVFKDIYRQISESFQKLSINIMSIGREDYDGSLSGFSERGALGEGFRQDDREIMTIRSEDSLKTNVYLTGKVYDTFEENQWHRYNEDTSAERFLDAAQTLYAVQRYDKEYQVDYVYRTSLDICYQFFKSRYLFAPLKTWSLEEGDRILEFEEEGGSLLFDMRKGYGTEYEIIYYQLNEGKEAFEEFLKADLEEDEQLLWEILQNLKGRTAVELTAEDLERHEHAVYENYLGEFTLSAELEAYLAQVLGDADTDVEKLKAIEAHLASLTYNNNPGEMPENVVDGSSFLDYFLLESRQGYCSHFATAFVLLARAEGIPARYVQGYCVPMEGNKEVTVTSDMAHAWPEVYLDDIGWIPFEPTPGYGEVRYTPWEIKKGETVVSSDFSDNYDVMAWEEYEEEEEELTEDMTAAELVDENVRDGNLGKILRILALSFVAVVIVGVLLLFLERLIGRYRYRRMNEEQKYLAEIRRSLKILSWLGMERGAGETLEELRERISEHLALEEDIHFVKEYEEFLYGGRCADECMIKLAEYERDELLQILKQKRKWTYLYYRLFVN